MSSEPIQRITQTLSNLFEEFSELTEDVERRLGSCPEEDYENASIAAIAEALETVIDDDELTPQYVASFIRTLIDALEELHPDAFKDETAS